MEQAIDQLGIEKQEFRDTMGCRGLTIAELGLIDFSKIDFTEWIDMMAQSDQLPIDRDMVDVTGSNISNGFDRVDALERNKQRAPDNNWVDRRNEMDEGDGHHSKFFPEVDEKLSEDYKNNRGSISGKSAIACLFNEDIATEPKDGSDPTVYSQELSVGPFSFVDNRQDYDPDNPAPTYMKYKDVSLKLPTEKEDIFENLLSKSNKVESLVNASFLQPKFKRNYLQAYQKRLKKLQYA